MAKASMSCGLLDVVLTHNMDTHLAEYFDSEIIMLGVGQVMTEILQLLGGRVLGLLPLVFISELAHDTPELLLLWLSQAHEKLLELVRAFALFWGLQAPH